MRTPLKAGVCRAAGGALPEGMTMYTNEAAEAPSEQPEGMSAVHHNALAAEPDQALHARSPAAAASPPGMQVLPLLNPCSAYTATQSQPLC